MGVLLLLGVVVACAVGDEDVAHVRVGYFPSDPLPFLVGAARSWFDSEGVKVSFYHGVGGAKLAAMLDSGDLDMAVMGSSPFAEATIRGAELVAFYVQYVIGPSEALVTRASIKEPGDLAGTRIATSFGSTMHYHLDYVKNMLVPGDFEIVEVESIEDAWDAGEIDGAFYYGGPIRHLKDHGGRELLNSALIGDWGRPTFQLVAASKRFAETRAAQG